MSLKKAAAAFAVAMLGVIASSASVWSAEGPCDDLYNRMMRSYQTLGPRSPLYAAMFIDYQARCHSTPTTVEGYYNGRFRRN